MIKLSQSLSSKEALKVMAAEGAWFDSRWKELISPGDETGDPNDGGSSGGDRCVEGNGLYRGSTHGQ